MKKRILVFLGSYMLIFYISLDAAARSKSSSHHNGSWNSSALARSSSSMESYSLSEPGRPLTPAEYERLTNAKGDIEKTGVASVSVNQLINLVTDASLHDIVANDLLAYIRIKLLQEQRLARIRNVINQASESNTDITDVEGLAAVILDDQELATINSDVVDTMLTTLELFFKLPPIDVISHRLALLSESQLEDLIDAAAEGKLADMITPLQFLELLFTLSVEYPDISAKQRNLIDIMSVAAINSNIKLNPTYNSFANDQRQNEVLQESENTLNNYYATSGRQRRSATIKQAKKSFAQRFFARRKR
jgi:hypothetical protein